MDAAPQFTTKPPTRARTGVIVLVAALAEVVIIAAADNQSVSDKISRSAARTDSASARELAGSWLTYTWRFDPRAHLTSQFWSEIGLVLTTIVVSCLLIAAVVRGPITFWRAFFGTWTAVLAATLVGAFVRGLIDDTIRTPGYNRLTAAAFGNAGPGAHAAAAGFVLGLVVALITALAAVAARRPAPYPTGAAGAPAEADHYVPPEQPPAFFGAPGSMPPWQDQHYGPPRHAVPDAGATTQLPAIAPDEPTTRLPQPAEGEGEQQTVQFPRPPDDERLGR